MLRSGEDYLYLPKVSFTHDLAGTKVTHGCMVATRQKIFLLPSSSSDARGFTLSVSRFSFDGVDVRAAVLGLTADPEMTVSELEGALEQMLDGVEGHWVYPLTEVSRLTINTAWWSTFTAAMVLQGHGGPPRGISIKGKEMRMAAKGFFAGLER